MLRERRCIVRRISLTEDRLIRFVASPDGVVTPDIAARLPGRGLWVTAHRDTVIEAGRKGLFARAAKAQLKLPGEGSGQSRDDAAIALADLIETQLRDHALAGLGFAKRGAALVHGRMRVEERINKGPIGALVEAGDAAEDGRRQVRSKLFGLEREAGERHAPILNIFTVAELSLALGAENVVHAAVNPGKLCRALVQDAEKLTAFMATDAPDASIAAQ